MFVVQGCACPAPAPARAALLPPARAAGADAPGGDEALVKSAGALRSVSFVSFWLQLALSIVSAAVLLFSVAISGALRRAPD